ncbi:MULTISPECIES: tape measure protein [Microbacterium]|uniref:phage tail protein n=1 Tax=Microbacterium TaxID=33882 RepID=UPI000D657495|nr:MULTISPECIES: tape measure protein [Microbacterium]
MADYNLGTAQGKVVIDTDVKGVKDAEEALDDLEKKGDDAAKAPQKISAGWVAGMAIVGTVVSQAAMAVSQAVGDWIADAVAASDANDKFRKSMEFAGLDTSAIDTAAARAQAYADSTVYSLDTILNAVASFTANGVTNANDLVESIGNFNAVAGGTEETFQRLLLASTQTASAGKLTAENWNQLADAVPGGAGTLMKALEEAGAYTGNFREAMSAGEITAEEFNAALLTLGSKPVAVEAAQSVSTMEGAVGNLNAIIVGGLAKAIDFIKPALTGLLAALGETITAVFAGIAEVVNFVRDNFDWVAPLAVAIAAATAVWVAWNAAITAWQTITKIGTAVQAAFNAVMAANPIMLIVMAIAALVAGLVYFFTQTELGREVWANFTRFLGEAWANVSQFLTETFTNVANFFNETWVAIAGFFEDTWNNIQSFVTSVVLAIYSFFVGFGNDVRSWWEGLWDTVFSIFEFIWKAIETYIMTIVGVIIGIFTGDFSKVPNIIQDIWNRVMQFTQDVWNNVLNWLGSVPGWIMDVFNGAGEWLYNIGKDILNGLWEGLQDIWNGLVGWIEDIGSTIADTFANVMGIHSPSRVMAALGEDTMRGLLIGMEGMEPALNKQINALGAGLAGGLSASMQAAIEAVPVDSQQPTDGARTFIYNSNGPGFDAEDEFFAAIKRAKVVVPGW